MLSCSGLGEKCVEGIITASSSLVTRHLPIRLHTGEEKKHNRWIIHIKKRMIERPRNQENLQTPDIENETNNQKQLRSKPSKGSLLDHNNDAKDSGTYLNTVLETIQLPACISDLNAGLTDMDRDALSHCRCFLQTPSKALTREQERKQTDRSLYFTKTFETGTKMQRKYWLTKVAESLKTNGRENLRGKRVQ
jgi:hypothetical protein